VHWTDFLNSCTDKHASNQPLICHFIITTPSIQAFERANERMDYIAKHPNGAGGAGQWDPATNPNLIDDFMDTQRERFGYGLQVAETAFCASVDEALAEATGSALRLLNKPNTSRSDRTADPASPQQQTQAQQHVGAIFWSDEPEGDVLAVALMFVVAGDKKDNLRVGLFSLTQNKPTLKLFQRYV
jgi:hypothetical protein